MHGQLRTEEHWQQESSTRTSRGKKHWNLDRWLWQLIFNHIALLFSFSSVKLPGSLQQAQLSYDFPGKKSEEHKSLPQF